MPPVQDHDVDQARVESVSESTVVHWLPVPASSFQRSWYTVYVPVSTVSHCPQMDVAARFSTGVGAGEADARAATRAGMMKAEKDFILKEWWVSAKRMCCVEKIKYTQGI